MTPTDDVLGIVSLASAMTWSSVGIVSAVRSRIASPFERAIAAIPLVIGGWALVDAISILVSGVNPPDLRPVFLAVATLLLLLATKWIAMGHSRYDGLLLLPATASVAFVLLSLTPTGLWAIQEVSYLAAALVLWGVLHRGRTNLTTSVRRRFFWTVGILLATLAIGSLTTIVDPLPRNEAPLLPALLSSLLIVPAVVVLLAVLPLTREDWSGMLAAISAIRERVTAVYMFYRTGEPLVALASNRNLPIEAEQLEAILSVVGNFVETSVASSRGYAITAMRYEGLGLLAVRGEFVIIAAVYDGPAYDALRSELTRTLKVFEERSWKELRTWEDATKVAEAAASLLSNLLYRPERTAPPSLPHPTPAEAKPGKSS